MWPLLPVGAACFHVGVMSWAVFSVAMSSTLPDNRASSTSMVCRLTHDRRDRLPERQPFPSRPSLCLDVWNDCHTCSHVFSAVEKWSKVLRPQRKPSGEELLPG